MTWTNFLTESMKFMEYRTLSRRRKMRFWLYFPVAAWKFYRKPKPFTCALRKMKKG